MNAPRPEEPAAPSLARLALDLGPLLIFFAVNAAFGIYAATGAFMAAIVASLAVSRLLYARFPAMALVTAAFVLVFGGLTLWLRDETFIKIKPTVIYLLFAGLLLAGLALKRNLLKLLMGELIDLTEEGWRRLTYRWTGFFAFLALLNEIVWRSVSTDAWVSFKVFGLLPLTLLFAGLQAGLLKRHARDSRKG